MTLQNNVYQTIFCILSGSFSLLAAGSSPPEPPKLNASAYLLQDFNSGRILVESNASARVEPASITKIMTTYVVFTALKEGRLKIDDTLTVSKNAWRTKGSKMFIEVNSKVPVIHLLKGMIIQSGNDAAVALAENIAGSEAVFVDMMNRQAKQLAMLNTHFMNVTGWPEENHYTTAVDMAILSRHMINQFPEYYPWHQIKEYTYNGIKQYNRNKLLWSDASVDGIKTGHTDVAGYCLVSSAKRYDMRLLAVVFGANSEEERNQESEGLLNYGFRFFETYRLYKAKQILQAAKVWKGNSDKLELGLHEDLYITIARGQHEFLNTEVIYNEPILAPIQSGQVYGKITVTLAGTEIASAKVFALNEVQDGGFWRRTVDEIKLLFH